MRLQERLNRRLSRITEPQILFPALALVFLVIIWGTTLGVLRLKRNDAEAAAALATQNLLDTYEAQIVRALREISQTLNLVKLWPGRSGQTLAALKREGLLPPDLLFMVSVADRNGNITASTRKPELANVASQDYFREPRQDDSFFVGRLPQGPTGEAQLHFSRRLSSPDGSFDGVVIVTVDAAYFVSNYEQEALGRHGVVGLLGADGSFRVRRSGDAIYSGDTADYQALTKTSGDGDTPAIIVRSSWDGARRWLSAREVYGFPLAVLAGLSVDEQMAAAQHRAHPYLWWATAASMLVILVTAILGRMSWQLARIREREGEAKIAHAEQVEYLAYHDGLTGLPNRSLFSKLLTQAITAAQRDRHWAAVAFLDLDRFKQVNDTLGHEAGDQLLKEVASRLCECVRDGDTVARLGGDEFVVLFPHLFDEQDAAAVAQKILEATARPFMLLGQEFRVTASIGISTFPRDGLDEQTLKKNADIAMYHAKIAGKNNFQFYSAKLTADSLERLALESNLRHALQRNEFLLLYQAKREIGSGRITGMEALLRWQHPDLGLVAPLRFLPVAEESGLMIPIGKWVLRNACEQCVAWRNLGMAETIIAVNLTARQFRDESLLPDLKRILAETRMDPRQLEIELHESLLIQHMDDTLRILTQIKALRVRVAVDDFGSGYVTLATLQRFPLDTIKIDRSVTRGFADAEGNTDLADAVIAMGKSLSLTVVAQGVETREQADTLTQHACDELQGFYFDQPISAAQVTRRLELEGVEARHSDEPGAALSLLAG